MTKKVKNRDDRTLSEESTGTLSLVVSKASFYDTVIHGSWVYNNSSDERVMEEELILSIKNVLMDTDEPYMEIYFSN
ncbi:hypothetical protein Golax_022863 [Gossypium laxum]|uniref:Uncharacterized protein n=1 Tax=Gossypium laxum TaxID=34288 RepID=A0A7J9B479_9ROSI|nr:hypothetical protein [Gossypium laxum]